jgi:signal transduction histidine kinase
LIRIIEEAIINSINHSKGNIINVNVVIDNYIEENDKENKNEEINSNDIHQINFIIEDIKRTSINIKISDNGNGFLLQEDNVLISNNMYGITDIKR